MAVESGKLKIIQALIAWLEGITPANGFTSDLSNAVFAGREKYGDSDPKTMISILEAPRPDFGTYAAEGQFRTEKWVLLLQGWAPDDVRNPTFPLYSLMAEVENRLLAINARDNASTGQPLHPEIFMFQQALEGHERLAVESFTFGPGVVRPATEGVSSRAFFYLQVSIGLVGSVG